MSESMSEHALSCIVHGSQESVLDLTHMRTSNFFCVDQIYKKNPLTLQLSNTLFVHNLKASRMLLPLIKTVACLHRNCLR